LLLNLLRNRGLLKEKNSVALYGISGIFLQLPASLVLQQSRDLLVVFSSTQFHGRIAFVSREDSERLTGYQGPKGSPIDTGYGSL
jgi:hypothetical protein